MRVTDGFGVNSTEFEYQVLIFEMGDNFLRKKAGCWEIRIKLRPEVT
jgi:hypothetical protein